MKSAKISNNTVSNTPKKLALHLAIAGALLTGYGGRKVYAGSCAGGPSNFVCSGAVSAADVTQTINGNPLDISTVSGFGIDTYNTGGVAFSIYGPAGAGNIIFDDSNNSTISGTTGIRASNYGSGYLSLTTTGSVSGTNGDGIRVDTDNGSGNVSIITQGTVSGSQAGIESRNYGDGINSIVATETITGGSEEGIDIRNGETTTNLSINAQAPISGTGGIRAGNYGSGTVNISTNAVTGNNGVGIRVNTYYLGSSVTIDAQGAVSGNGGIDSSHYGSGNHTITTSSVAGNGGTGLSARSDYGADNMSITANGAVNGTNGITATNYGSGATTVISANTVTATNGNGIQVNNSYGGAQISLTAQGNVTATQEAIEVDNYGTNTSITTYAIVSSTTRDAIDVQHNGGGNLTIDSRGYVSSTTRRGIDAYANFNANDANVSVSGNVTADDQAILLENYGNGGSTVSVTNATITSNTSNGIDVRNDMNATTLTISTLSNASINGQISGINAYNNGMGNTSITTTGPVTGTSSSGIYAYGGSDSNNLDIYTFGTVSGRRGINTALYSSGNLSITTQAAVTGTNGIGIEARLESSGSNLNIQSVSTVSGNSGIMAYSYGSGQFEVTTNNTVTATSGSGIYMQNGSDTSTFELDVRGDINSTAEGIQARNYSMATTVVSSTNANIVSSGGIGADIRSFNAASGMSVNLGGAVSGATQGFYARNYGTYTNVTVSGMINSSNGRGLVAYNGGDSTSMNVRTLSSIQSRNNGLEVQHYGSGDLDVYALGTIDTGNTAFAAVQVQGEGGVMSITTKDTITATAGRGIYAYSSSTSTDMNVTVEGNINSPENGLNLRNSGTGVTNINISSATVSSSTDRGVYLYQDMNAGNVVITATGNVDGASYGLQVTSIATAGINLTASGTIQGGSNRGIALLTPPGQMSTVNLNSGASLINGMYSNDGDSMITVASGASVAGRFDLTTGSDVLMLNGGDFSGVTLFDGGDDIFVADGFIDTLSFQGSSGLLVGSDVINWENIIIDAGSVISFNGNDDLMTGQLSVINSGVLSLQDDAADDDLNIDGNFVGGGSINIDAVLSDSNSPTDILRINGDTSGNTILNVNNFGGAGGNTTGDGILIVQVTGASTGTFSLSAPLNVNGFEYTLVQVGNDWYLQGVATDADLSITKDLLTSAPFVVGDTVTYELVISNNGPLDATNVVVSDTFTNLSFVSLSGGTCAPASFPCTIASLPNGSSETLTVTATIDSVGTFDNAAAVSGDQPDANSADNIDDTGNGGETLGQFNVGVTVTGLAAGNAVELLNNGGDNLLVNTNNSLTNFSMPLNDFSDYEVTIETQPTMPNQTCTFVGANSGTINSADVTDIEINCVTDTYFIGGTVNGLFEGNYLVLQNNGGDDEIIMGNGAFVFSTPIEDEQNYNVSIDMQPDNPIQPCMVSNNTGSVMGADVTDVMVTCEFGDDLIFRNGFEVPPPPPPPNQN